MGKVTVIDHPLIQHKLTIMRDRDTCSKDFRELLTEISMLMGFEITRNLELEDKFIKTPVCSGDFPVLKQELFTIVPILRAGLGMVDGLHRLMPFAHIGHLGMYRDEETKEPVEYFCKMPPRVQESSVFIVDPMLATGGSAVDAIDAMKRHGCTDIRVMNLVAAPEGIEVVQKAHPDTDIFVAAIDEGLNSAAYIVPGLGDAGDRIYGTK